MEAKARALRWLIGLSLGIGLLVVVNELRIPFFLYYPRTTTTVLISELFDVYFFVATTACVPLALFLSRRSLSKSGMLGIVAIWIAGLMLLVGRQAYGVPTLYATVAFTAVLNLTSAEDRRAATVELSVCTLTILVLIESAALYYWAVSALNPEGQVGLLSEQLEANLTYSLFPLGPIAMILLLFSWLWIPLAMKYFLYPQTTMTRNYFKWGNATINHEGKWNRRVVIAAVDLFAILSILVYVYPYLAGQTWIVGVDSYIRYVDPTNSLVGQPLTNAIFTSSRHGLYLVILYLIQRGTGFSSFWVVRFAPLFLEFTGALAVFVMIRQAGWKLELAIISAVCAILWLPTTLGIYAGIQANWLVFVLWMLFLALSFRNVNFSIVAFVSQSLISAAILLIHPWTWGVFFATLVANSVISMRSKLMKSSITTVLSAIVVTVPLGIAAYQFSPGMQNDIGNTLSLYSFFFYHPTYSLLIFQGALTEVLNNWSSFFPPILLLICLVGAYSLSSHQGAAKNYILAWTAIWCVGSFLVAPIGFLPMNPAASETQLWRIMYASPLPFLLAMGLEKCVDLSKKLDPLRGTFPVSRQQPIIISVLLVVLSATLFAFQDPFVRIAIILVAVAIVLLLSIRFPQYQAVRILTIAFLVLVIVNSAYRSLYPLLLNPHNLFGSFGVGE
jgi:hypothetical protein